MPESSAPGAGTVAISAAPPQPSSQPTATPSRPTTSPSATKVATTLPRGRPMERMMAMSRAFSVTTVEMMLKMPNPATSRIEPVLP